MLSVDVSAGSCLYRLSEGRPYSSKPRDFDLPDEAASERSSPACRWQRIWRAWSTFTRSAR